MDARMGSNINGPSLIRVPEWVENPLGKYYLYFGHHQGKYIRLAYADNLEGPWSIHKPGVLDLENAYCASHLSSPDVHIFDDRREIRMYYHGPIPGKIQQAKVSQSQDGLSFTALPEDLGNSYFRVFHWQEYTYALGMPGIFYRSKNGLTHFEQGPTLFTEDMRHTALELDGSTLTVYYSDAFDCPERILSSTIDLRPDWMNWTHSEAQVILEPEEDYEGADLPLEPSARGSSHQRVRQLRDPGIYREDDETYLLYSVAGESGIAIARFTD
jgi:hypothetical protein